MLERIIERSKPKTEPKPERRALVIPKCPTFEALFGALPMVDEGTLKPALPPREPKRRAKRKYEFHVQNAQAERIITKFGGPHRMAKILAAVGKPRRYETILRWLYPRDRNGTDGMVPSGAWPDIFYAARMEGIVITPEDLDPRVLRPSAADAERTRQKYPRGMPVADHELEHE